MDHNPSRLANNGIYYASLDGRENRLLLHSQTNAIYADWVSAVQPWRSVDGAAS